LSEELARYGEVSSTSVNHKITYQADGRCEILFAGEPPYVEAIPSRLASMPPSLRSGRWLVLFSAVWSVPDIKAIDVALAAVRKFGGEIRLGVCLFDEYSEVRAWLPELKVGRTASPIWVIMEDGRLLNESSWPKRIEEVEEMIEQIIGAPRRPEFGPSERRNAETLIDLALAEDLGQVGDITATATIPDHARGSGRFVARAEGVVAGLPVVALLAGRFGLGDDWRPLRGDGDRVGKGDEIARVAGPMRALLAMERTALNFLQRMSGVATLTARFVAEVAGTRAVILDTRKTTPGWRALEKYAVRCGGGRNHRIGLHDAVLIKDNHLAWLAHQGDPIGSAIASARSHAPSGTVVEVEVDSLDQLDRALECGPDIILVDNLGPEALAEAVRRRDARAPGILLEASGGVTLQAVRALAETGVDRISVGALTHSAPALDVGLDYLS
jgi:nicotinate-nucleotide pyrophosphorylase (carboxylating)